MKISVVQRPLLIACALGLTVASGLLQGRMTGRWDSTRDIVRASQQLQRLPERFGRWQVRRVRELSPVTLDTLECTGYVFREYVNTSTGDVANLVILLGPAGPMLVHTPEICYPSEAYMPEGERRRVAIAVGPDSVEEFWATTFRSNHINAEKLRVYYAWGLGEHWSAGARPRWSLAGHCYLYKIQLTAPLSSDDTLPTTDPCQAFLRDFLSVAKAPLIVPLDRPSPAIP
jgi:hypothetical protein